MKMLRSDVWVIIPAKNEEKRIVNVIKGVKKYTSNIVVVDDGSIDKTSEVSMDEGIVVLKHIINLGKGAALKTGCDFAISKKAKAVVLIDSDGQHDPEEIPKFIAELKNSDIVLGARSINKGMPVLFQFGNKIINKTIKVLFNIELSDTQSGYRAFNTKIYPILRWQSVDYSVESEMIAKIGRYKMKYKEIQIKTIYHDKYKGTTVLDGVKIVFNMFFYKMFNNPLRGVKR